MPSPNSLLLSTRYSLLTPPWSKSLSFTPVSQENCLHFPLNITPTVTTTYRLLATTVLRVFLLGYLLHGLNLLLSSLLDLLLSGRLLSKFLKIVRLEFSISGPSMLFKNRRKTQKGIFKCRIFSNCLAYVFLVKSSTNSPSPNFSKDIGLYFSSHSIAQSDPELFKYENFTIDQYSKLSRSYKN